MRYKASVHLKKADTSGRVPASILDGFVREELLQKISAAIKPHLVIRQPAFTDLTQSETQADQVNFTTELIVLPGDRWNQFREQLSQWGHHLAADEFHHLQALLDTVEYSTKGVGGPV
ncbi:hypothetical protein GCM10027341_43020 [Spirosoma knui]